MAAIDASPTKISLSTIEAPEFWVKPTPSSAKLTSELLQQNHDRHHIFFNESHFHNHIVHHLLTIYALGATPEQIQHAYDRNAEYQRDINLSEADEEAIDLSDTSTFLKSLANEHRYRAFLLFFQKEMEKKGWKQVLLEYVFSEDSKIAHEMYARLFAGALHPFIHLGFGVEFEQPAIIAEALAETAVHENKLSSFFYEVEKKGKEFKGPKKHLSQLIEETRKDEELKASVTYEDDSKILDGLVKRGNSKILKYTSQFRVEEATMKKDLAEMYDAVVYYSAASQRSEKSVKFDFISIHHINSSIFLSRFAASPWLTTAQKLRLLTWKARLDLVQYVASGSPVLKSEEIETYKSKQPSDWSMLFERGNTFEDDGHSSKMIRALAHGERLCAVWTKKSQEEGNWMKLGDDMWKRIGNMEMDAVEQGDPHYVTDAGWDEAWKDVPARGEYRIL